MPRQFVEGLDTTQQHVGELDLTQLKITVTQITKPIRALNRARLTVGKAPKPMDYKPSQKFIVGAYFSEHSPIREVTFDITVENVPSWVATHFVRHHVGSQPYVSTGRKDRCTYEGPRGKREQGELVTLALTLNAQSIIDISQERLCNKASVETRYVWQQIINQIQKLDCSLAIVCVPKCVYRGFCPEPKSCNYWNTKDYRYARRYYLDAFQTIVHEGVMVSKEFLEEGR